ncbi:hypothetical protein ACFE04_028416 [Oxalis oulophora]
MVESLKYTPVQARFYEEKEPIQFYTIFQSLIVFKGGLSSGYKKYVAEKEIPDDTYREDGVALFRLQGSGPDNMQAIQVETAASSLNSSYCYILHSESTVFTWSGNHTNAADQELMERILDLIKPNIQTKPQKEGSESELFWESLGGKSEYSSNKLARVAESDPHLFTCNFSKGMNNMAEPGNLKVTEIHSFTQDDLMTEDMFILDCRSEVFVWIGKQVDAKNRIHALTIGQKFIEHDFLLEKVSPEAPLFIIMEGSEPPFFTRFFAWDSSKFAMHGNSFQRKLSIVKNGGTTAGVDKPKRRPAPSYGGRSSVPDSKSGRSRSMSFSPDRVRVRGRSPAFNALAAAFENSNSRNQSTPPPTVRKIYPKSVTPDSAKLPAKSTAISTLTSSFEKAPPPARGSLMPRSVKGQEATKEQPDTNSKEISLKNNIESLTITEDSKEGEADDDDGLPTYPYERLRINSEDPVAEIDVTKREAYLSSEEFREKFSMTKNAFLKLPKWKQNKLKMAVQLF